MTARRVTEIQQQRSPLIVSLLDRSISPDDLLKLRELDERLELIDTMSWWEARLRFLRRRGYPAKYRRFLALAASFPGFPTGLLATRDDP